MRHLRNITVFLLGVLALGAGFYFGRTKAQSNSASTPAAADTRTTPSSGPAYKMNPPAPTRTPAFNRTRTQSAAEFAPLPPANTPVKQIYDSLAARAKAGDAAASMRLFYDLQRCNKRGQQIQLLNAVDSWTDPSTKGFSPDQRAIVVKQANDEQQHLLDSLNATDQLCAGIPASDIDHFGEWLRTAALDGDAEAMVCYAAMPNDFGPKYLTDAWFDWMQRWRIEAPNFAAQAYAAGQGDVVALFRDAYGTDGYRVMNERFPMYPYSYLVTPDPVLAAGYAMLYQRLVPQSSVDSAQYQVVSAQEKLTPAQIVQAREFADAAWPNFAAQAGLRDNLMPCSASLRAGNPGQ
ncbi:MAG: hypothetical protein ACREPN_00310 [Rudaea sp.]